MPRRLLFSFQSLLFSFQFSYNFLNHATVLLIPYSAETVNLKSKYLFAFDESGVLIFVVNGSASLYETCESSLPKFFSIKSETYFISYCVFPQRLYISPGWKLSIMLANVLHRSSTYSRVRLKTC